MAGARRGGPTLYRTMTKLQPARMSAVLLLFVMPAAIAKTCYVDRVFANSSIQLFSDIQFGSAFNNKTAQQETLLLDAYLPPADNRTARPVVVVVHGGGFTDGTKTWQGDVDLAREFAMRGFVAVSVNYRLTGDFWPWESEREILDGVEDVRAAIRYVRSVADDQMLDTTRILLAGESAGAWISLFIGYVEKAQYEGASGNPGWPSDVSAVMSISGELKGQAYCSRLVAGRPVDCQINTDVDHTEDVKGAGASFHQPPLLMLHGTADLVVPYVNGKAVYDRAQSVGLSSTLLTMQGAPHVPWDTIFGTDVLPKSMATVADSLQLAKAQQPAGCVPLAA